MARRAWQVKKTGQSNREVSYSPKEFLLDDYPRTLYPLNTNKIVIENGEAEVRGFIDEQIKAGAPFLTQRRVYASKDALHFRRTVKLDPVAEYFLYDLIYRYRSKFRKAHDANREHFGYRFDGGRPISASKSYSDFKSSVFLQNLSHRYFLGFDVASYFNNLYHHDLVEWFSALGADQSDVELFGRFLREANAGRSVDCLPQGIYPTKMIGNDFLRFVEESHALKSVVIKRFMDDFCLFSDAEVDLTADFSYIQRLLGQKGLSVNPSKTSTSTPRTEQADSSVDSVKKRLLKRRKVIVSSSLYDATPTRTEIDIALSITPDELKYISGILDKNDLEEEDAELILTVMRRHTADVEKHIPEIMGRFPHLAKNVYTFCSDVPVKDAVAEAILSLLGDGSQIQEYQLFWFGMMLEDYLMDLPVTPKLIDGLFNHRNSTDISKAKILEIPDMRFGLQ